MSVHDRLAALGIPLSKAAPAAGAYAPFVRAGDLVFLSGHIARKSGAPWTGRLGADMTIEAGREAARAVAIDLLGTLHAAAGDLESVRRIVKLTVLVNSEPTFTRQPLVADGASDLLIEVFGERGAHARCAFGVTQLPLGSCVEIDLVAEVAPIGARPSGGE